MPGFPFIAVVKTSAILIGKKAHTETSLLVFWCSAEEGLIKTVAKGARRASSPFAGRLDLFYAADIQFVRSRKSDWHTLHDVSVVEHRMGLQQSYLRLLAASYFVRLVELIAEPGTPLPELFDLLARALQWLDANDPTLKALLHFEKQAAQALGMHAPTGSAPIQVIRQTYHRIPDQRGKLLEALK